MCELKKQDVSYFSPDEIYQAPENGLLYDNFAPNADPDDYKLYTSIKEEGIREPLHVSAGGVCLSGHRRLAVARDGAAGPLPSLERSPPRHDKKPGSVYQNDKGSYKTLTNYSSEPDLPATSP